MIKQNIVKPNFEGEIGRMDYLGVNLAIIGIYFVGAIVVGGGAGLLENVGGTAASVGTMMLGLLVVAGVLWTSIVALSILVKRFRNMGMTSTATLVIATIGFIAANSVVPLMTLIPLLWPTKKEAV